LLPVWFFVVRRVYQLSARIAAKAALRDLQAILHALYQNLKRDRKFRVLLLVALISTLVWWYLDRWAATVLNDDPYSILGLTPPVTIKEIKKAYRRKGMRYHFD
jgi:preprotein translocase subunit Sec63